MVQLQILSGKMAGTKWSSRHFPFSVGRSASNDFQLEEPGVFARHFEVTLENSAFIVAAATIAFLAINGRKADKVELKNGDVVELGTTKIRMSLQGTVQAIMVSREISTWVALALLCVGQIALIYWL